jgi:hypothetical protein
VFEDRSPEVGILLFVIESLLASLLLLPRAVLAVRTAAREVAREASAASEWRLGQARQLLQRFTLIFAFGLGFVPFLWIAALLGGIEGGSGALGGTLLHRASWMGAMLLASAVLDVVLVPSRGIASLQTAVAWQQLRVVGLHPVILFGLLLVPFTGSTEGLVWLFVALRLALDLASLRPGSGEAVRASTFGRLHPPDVIVDSVTGEVVSAWPPVEPPVRTPS